MKSVAAGVILIVISWALFLALMGSNDAVRVPTFHLALPLSFIYAIFAFGLIKYRSPHPIVGLVGFILLCGVVVLVVYSMIVPSALTPRLFGRSIFGVASVDNVFAFFIPWKLAKLTVPNQSTDP